FALRSLVSACRVVAEICSGWTTFASRSALMSVSPSFPAPMTAIFFRASIRPPNHERSRLKQPKIQAGDRIKSVGTGARTDLRDGSARARPTLSAVAVLAAILPQEAAEHGRRS